LGENTEGTLILYQIMKREFIEHGLPFVVVISEFFNHCDIELGKIKTNEIIEKIKSSKKVKKFINESLEFNQRLSPLDFINCINSSSSFFFSNQYELAYANSILLVTWNEEVGSIYDLSDDIYLNTTLFSILDDFKKKFKIQKIDFYESYNKKLFNIFIQNHSENAVKNYITLDLMMCEAIEKKIKTQLISNDNLNIINLEPNDWEFIGYNSTVGLNLHNRYSDEFLNITFPYELGSIIDVFEDENSITRFKIKITSAFFTRIQNLNENDADNLGYGIFEDDIEKIYEQDPAEDALLLLMRNDCLNKFGYRCLIENYWVLIFYFDLIEPDDALELKKLMDAEKAKRSVNWENLIAI